MASVTADTFHVLRCVLPGRPDAKARAPSLRGTPGEGVPPRKWDPNIHTQKMDIYVPRSQCVIGYITRLSIGQSLCNNGLSTFLMGAPGIDKRGDLGVEDSKTFFLILEKDEGCCSDGYL